MKAMKPQAIAFLLGFTLTSFVLFLIPGVAKKTSQVTHPIDGKLTSLLHDSAVLNGHFSTSPTVVAAP